jgi:hypothetical protein
MARSKAELKKTTASLRVVPGKQELATLDTEPDHFAAYARAMSWNNTIIGMMLKFSKGEFVVGQDGEVMEMGTKLIANSDELLIGWQRWEDAKPAEDIRGYLVKGFQPPRRDELSFNDSSEWDVDESNGKPRDPWVATNWLLLKEPGKRGQLYTFVTSSHGGKKAMGALAKACSDHRKEYGNVDYPVVALDSSSYLHPNSSLGRIKEPVFEVVGWENKSLFADASDAPAPSRKKGR